MADVQRIVRSFENEGWFWDKAEYLELHSVLLGSVCRAEYLELHSVLLESVCRATPQARVTALAALAATATVDPRRLFEESGQKLTTEVATALSRQREHRALSRAVLRAETNCPFWIVARKQYKRPPVVRKHGRAPESCA